MLCKLGFIYLWICTIKCSFEAFESIGDLKIDYTNISLISSLLCFCQLGALQVNTKLSFARKWTWLDDLFNKYWHSHPFISFYCIYFISKITKHSNTMNSWLPTFYEKATLTSWQYCCLCCNWLFWQGPAPVISQLVSLHGCSISVVLAHSNAVFWHLLDEMQPISIETKQQSDLG